MTGLGLVFLVHDLTSSCGRAGIVAGAFAVSEAVIGPQTARLIDRYGQTRVLPLTLAGSELLPTAFALESMASSVAFLAGPALLGTVATLADPRAASPGSSPPTRRSGWCSGRCRCR
jgi:hypothetical protein